MEAKDATLEQVFKVGAPLHAPLFQRPYVWRETDNWEPLWESVKAVAEQKVRYDLIRPHFLGAIVLKQLEAGDQSRLVIDGQQRLITLQIMIAAIRGICNVHAPEKDKVFLDTAFKDVSEENVPAEDEEDGSKFFKFWPTNVDREDFNEIMRVRSPAKLEAKYGEPRPPIPECYLYFHRRVEEWLEDYQGEELTKRLKSLKEVIYKGLLVVTVNLQREDDPQRIFETLNHLGEPLTTADLVKNFLFNEMRGEDKEDNYEKASSRLEKFYEEIWKPLDDPKSPDGTRIAYWRDKVTRVRGGQKTYRIDLFLRDYMTLKRESRIETNLYDEFCSSFRMEKKKQKGKPEESSFAERQTRQLRCYADIFHKFDQYPKGCPENLFFERLKELKTDGHLPVLLELYRKVNESEFREILMPLESFVVRRSVCRKKYRTDFGVIFVDMIKHLSKRGFLRAEVVKFLKGQEDDRRKWPDDETFKDAFCNDPTPQKRKMLLLAMEYAMRTEDPKSEKVTIEEGGLTVEHILPKKWQEVDSYKLPEGSDDAEVRKKALELFGNLTLLTSKLNTAMSNSSWPEKKQEIEKHSGLKMNEDLLKYECWDEDTIRERSEKLFEYARKIWPHPDTPPPQKS